MRALPLLCLLALPCPALADGFLSVDLAQDGIAATEAKLSAQRDLTPGDRFAIGGLRFLGANGSISRITPEHDRIAWTNL